MVIRAENLGKKYLISHQRRWSRGSLREAMTHMARGAWQRLSHPLSPNRETTDLEEMWALKDVSFQVEQGDRIGIIGRNGAGKSTLLKILSRITEPTTGRVHLRGRVSSLLEVGTGFHPELTGRENVFLNGAILGMTRQEIRAKFDEIVTFAEIEKFLDTPVKHYSSGMYVRLAFAVAAHLEPEILIVDEVLAVGDAQFQKKCLGKMERAGEEGRTVLFVSHQASAVTRLCQQALWLDAGQVREFGQVTPICSHYFSGRSKDLTRREWADSPAAPGNEWVRMECVEARSEGMDASLFDIARPVVVSMTYRVLQGGKVLIPNVHFYGEDGTLIFVAHDWYSGWRHQPKACGRYRTCFVVPANFFSEGHVSLTVAVSTYQPFQVHFVEPDAISFSIAESDSGQTARGDYAGHLPGVVRPMIPTTTEVLP